MAALRLFPFKYREPLSGTWIKARYKATLEDIASRYSEWMIAGEPEIRRPSRAYFTPHRKHVHLMTTPRQDSSVETRPALDSLEAMLAATFLRRYVTWCARRGRFAAMEGAARLLARVRRP
jgi:hypothetical protein